VFALIRLCSQAVSNLMKIKNSHLKAFFPLHEEDLKQTLSKKWVSWKSLWSQPLYDIRDYFGESIGLYFCFLRMLSGQFLCCAKFLCSSEFYNKCLMIIAFLGIGFFVAQCILGITSVTGSWAFGIFVPLWGTYFLEQWKRIESYYQVLWGTTSFEDKEQQRPEFEGEFKRSPVNGRLSQYFPWHQKFWRSFVSRSVLLSLVVCVIACVVGIFILRELLEEWNSTYGSYIASVISAIQIMIFNAVFFWCCPPLLTEFLDIFPCRCVLERI
jgi:anoctamin-10